MKKILILTSGKKKKLTPFKLSLRNLQIDLTTASFNDVYSDSVSGDLLLKKGPAISRFEIIYFRLVGKSLETALLVAAYAKKNGIQIVDKIYENAQVLPITQSKIKEMQALKDAKITIPKTIFGSLDQIAQKGPTVFRFPFVIKSSTGSRGREVYSPNNTTELKSLITVLSKEEKLGKQFFAQEFVPTTKRIRVLIVGGQIIGSIVQLTKWRKRVTGYMPQEDEKKIDKFTPTIEMQNLAKLAVVAVGIDIAGVDILVNEQTGQSLVIEVNAAPSWKLIKKYCKVNVEYEILKFIAKI
ncbi:MAG TPA: ATP-grasp domain-containing protein [Patescibacteria group bacterium]|nr:ATP-grasp domain-containing protein [Patescibacteria group bacterium]